MAKEKTTQDKINKFLSRRWIITVWSCLMITAVVVLGYVYKDDSFAGLAMTLSAVPVAFCSLETINKWKRTETIEKEGVAE